MTRPVSASRHSNRTPCSSFEVGRDQGSVVIGKNGSVELALGRLRIVLVRHGIEERPVSAAAATDRKDPGTASRGTW